jgi:hypothetical protein
MFNQEILQSRIKALCILQKEYIHKKEELDKEIRPLLQLNRNLKLFNICNIQPRDLLFITNFKFSYLWIDRDREGNIIKESTILNNGQLYSSFYIATTGRIRIYYKHLFNRYYLSLIIKNKPSIYNRFSMDIRRLVESFMKPEEIYFYANYKCIKSYEHRCQPFVQWYFTVHDQNFQNSEILFDENEHEVYWSMEEHYEGQESCTYLINKILNGINGEYEKIMQF